MQQRAYNLMDRTKKGSQTSTMLRGLMTGSEIATSTHETESDDNAETPDSGPQKKKSTCTDISGRAKPIMLTHDSKIILAKAFSDHLKDGKPILFADVKAVFLANSEVAEMFRSTYPGVHGKEVIKKMYYAARNLSSKYKDLIYI